MKVTQQMYERVKDLNPTARNIWRSLEHALEDIPDVVPFAFEGLPNVPVFLHRCGTVTDAKEGTDLWAQVQAGECDCEHTSPWMRIYVERPSA